MAHHIGIRPIQRLPVEVAIDYESVIEILENYSHQNMIYRTFVQSSRRYRKPKQKRKGNGFLGVGLEAVSYSAKQSDLIGLA